MGVCSRQGKLIQLDGMIVTEHRLLRWQVSTDENVYATIFSPCDFGFCLCDFFFSELSYALLALPISYLKYIHSLLHLDFYLFEWFSFLHGTLKFSLLYFFSAYCSAFCAWHAECNTNAASVTVIMFNTTFLHIISTIY